MKFLRFLAAFILATSFSSFAEASTINPGFGGGGGGSSGFSGLTGGTNTSAAMVVGSGASLASSGTGSITATTVPAAGVTGTVAIVNGGTGGTAVDYQTILQNASAVNLPHWRAALGRVTSGTGSAKIFVIGDSQSVGYNNGFANQMLNSYPAMLMNMFKGAHIPATFESRIGDTLVTDPRFTIGSWTDLGTMIVGGNQATYAAGATATAQSFQTSTPVNACDLIYYAGAGAGSFSWNVDGGSPTTINETINTISKSTVTFPLALHKPGVNWVSGLPGYIGFDCYDTSNPSVDIVDGGATGTTSANWASSSPTAGSTTVLQSTTFLNQDLTIIMLGGNDWCTLGEGATAFAANIQAIITQAKTVGDVLLVGTTPTDAAGDPSGECTLQPSNAAQAAYISAEHALAATNNVPWVSIFDRWQSYAFSSASPYLFYESDGLHATPTGINDIAQALYPYLAAGYVGPINTEPTGTFPISYAAGTAYTLTATPAAITFGTTSPSITLTSPGVYNIEVRTRMEYVGATFAASRPVALKLRRTNNTAADLTNCTAGANTAITTTVTQTFDDVTFTCQYITANSNDVIVPFASVGTVPTAGSLQVAESIVSAIKLAN